MCRVAEGEGGKASKWRSPSGTREQRRGNGTRVPTPRAEISASRAHAVGSVLKWACLLTLVGVARVPALMKTTTQREERERTTARTSRPGCVCRLKAECHFLQITVPITTAVSGSQEELWDGSSNRSFLRVTITLLRDVPRQILTYVGNVAWPSSD